MKSKKFLIFDTSWKHVLNDEVQKPYFKSLMKFIQNEINSDQVIFPLPHNLIFNAFNLCHFDKIKVVILGQDPYHNIGQAHGLCFSVLKGIDKPPSLVNILKELNNDLGIEISENGDLTKWTMQGVFLLNSYLTVRAHEPMSHSRIGWEIFTDSVIKKISDMKEKVIFLLWGNPAQRKSSLINSEKHYILTAAHPSPLSAHRGFFGCKHFSQTNAILIKNGNDPINWQLENGFLQFSR
jgi:uracil-DNA glycosylase